MWRIINGVQFNDINRMDYAMFETKIYRHIKCQISHVAMFHFPYGVVS
jgi:hypothetical protein